MKQKFFMKTNAFYYESWFIEGRHVSDVDGGNGHALQVAGCKLQGSRVFKKSHALTIVALV